MARVHERNFKSTRLMRLIQTTELNYQQRNKKEKKSFCDVTGYERNPRQKKNQDTVKQNELNASSDLLLTQNHL